MGRAGGEADLGKEWSREKVAPGKEPRCDGVCDLEFSVQRWVRAGLGWVTVAMAPTWKSEGLAPCL